MKIETMVTKVNKLLDSTNGYSYDDMQLFFNEGVDKANETVFAEVFGYFPDRISSADAEYTDIPNRYLSTFMCYFVASKILGLEDEYEEQYKDYVQTYQNDLQKFKIFYFNNIEQVTVEGVGFSREEEYTEEQADLEIREINGKSYYVKDVNGVEYYKEVVNSPKYVVLDGHRFDDNPVGNSQIDYPDYITYDNKLYYKDLNNNAIPGIIKVGDKFYEDITGDSQVLQYEYVNYVSEV